ncbi:unnamed protein product [Rhizoctonia solani]|uniref:Phosphodeoxyriboaldolase n=1 Tax=Rhizoctonia solani TaxID=456999 RepID=A0A8H3GDQ4_9AGAM|nr:unnamed protein product [Rhizoctonia solani]
MPTVKLSVTLKDLSKMIDVSLLHPTMTDAEILAGLEAAKTCVRRSDCLHEAYSVSVAHAALIGTDVLVCPVIGPPAGDSSVAVKVFEATEVVKSGAQEVNMVINIGKALSGEWDYATAEIKQIKDAVVAGGAILKVIFEVRSHRRSPSSQLVVNSDRFPTRLPYHPPLPDLLRARRRVREDFDWLWAQPTTKSMYSYAGATDHNLKLMRKHSSEKVQVKAAGGVRTLNGLLCARALGATRVGATTMREMLQEAARRGIGKDPKGVEVVIPE